MFPLAKGGLVHAGPANGCHLEYNPRGARLSKFEKQTNKMLDSFDFHMKSSFNCHLLIKKLNTVVSL